MMTYPFNVYCSECGSSLKIVEETVDHTLTKCFGVKPCEICVDRAREVSYNKGYEEGYDDAYYVL